ncbi:MAG: hypothetical protein WAO23_00445 [Dethiobacteria bacterium]
MKFDDVIKAIGTIPDLRRVASAYVVDHRNLSEEETKDALLKVKPQYLHYDSVSKSMEYSFYGHLNLNYRVLSKIIIRDILLNEDGYVLSSEETEEKVMAYEQKMVNRSNEMDVSDLSSTNSQRQKDIELYYFVLKVAWEYQDNKSPDEINLLKKLRERLYINEWDNAFLEAKLGKYPKVNNDIHIRGEIVDARKFLQKQGLLFSIRDQNGDDLDIIPKELAEVMKKILNLEIKEPNYNILMQYKFVKKKQYLRNALDKSNIFWSNNDTVEKLTEKVIRNIQPSILLGGTTSRNGLDNESLHKWCSELDLPVSGTKQERIERIIKYYDNLRQAAQKTEDEREKWYEMYEALSIRDYSLLRGHNIISKDIEVERYFEEATKYLFEYKLNHTPLKQVGTNHPDGLLSFKDMYVMWDNKSKENPGLVNLKDHIKQFHDYMESTDKPVPVFLVIAPDFTEESEILAFQYTSDHLGRNIVLITAEELKCLAEEWSCKDNKRHDEPFPLGLMARAGRFNKKLIGKL